jgi:hypothetical protein
VPSTSSKAEIWLIVSFLESAPAPESLLAGATAAEMETASEKVDVGGGCRRLTSRRNDVALLI